MIIGTKKLNYQLCHAGAYGNRVRQWESLEAWRASGFLEPVAMRTALQAGGGPKAFNVQPADVELQAHKWMLQGISRECIRLSEMVDGLRILQGQYLNDVYVQDGEARWGYFWCTFATGAMPIAFKKESRTAFGLRADLLIRSAMTPSSYSDWRELLERYPGHVLEFSVWESCVGDIPGRNAIVWEIRRY